MSESASTQKNVAVLRDSYDRSYNKKLGTDTTSRTQSVPFKGLQSKTGVKLPNWHSIIREGRNATTSLTGTEYVLPISWCTAGQEWTRTDGAGYEDYGAEFYGYPQYPNLFSSFSQPSQSVITTVTNRCIRKFLEKAESIRSSCEAGQDIGEYRETLHGLTEPLGQLRRHVLSYFPKVKKLKGLYKDAKSLTKALADTYLEWTFGWHPLALDIADAYVGLQNRSRFLQRQGIRVSATDTFGGSDSQAWNLSSFGGLGNIRINLRSYGKYTVCMYGMINTGAGPDGLVSRAQTLQLDLPHFVPTIWDLIPYSFIVDYFVNVGDIIRAMSVVNSDFAWGGQDVITEWHYDYSDIYIVNSAQPSYMRCQDSWAYGGSSKFVRRDVSRSILVPSGLIPRVQFTLPLSDKPWVNMGAILASRIASLVPLI